MTSARRASLCVVFCGIMLAVGSKAQTLDKSATQEKKTYADSRSGIEEQFSDILRVVRMNDEASIHRALDTLSIPDANGWIAAHFTVEYVTQEQQSYRQGLVGNGKFWEVSRVCLESGGLAECEAPFGRRIRRARATAQRCRENRELPIRFNSERSETWQSVLGELVCLS